MVVTKNNIIYNLVIICAVSPGIVFSVLICLAYAGAIPNVVPACITAITEGRFDVIGTVYRNMGGLWFSITAIINLAIIVSLASFLFTYKLVFDDSGITYHTRINILFFYVFKYDLAVPWDKVQDVHKSYALHSFGYAFTVLRENGKEGMFCINFTQTNRKETLAYAARKLPADAFSNDIQGEFKKWDFYDK